VRRLTLIAVLALGLAACGGGSGGSKDTLQIKFGRTGGMIMPYEITIAPDGTVSARGNPPNTLPKSITSAQDEDLSGQVRDEIGKLTSLSCPKTFPDEAASFITAAGKTVTVRGTCEPAFQTLFNALTNALHLNE
jgi:hypothetical protein